MIVLRRIGAALALPLVLFTLWWVLSADSTDYFFPPLSRIVGTLADDWLGARLTADVLPSLLRLSAGFLVAAVGAVGLGVLIGLSRTLRAVLEPVLEFLRAIPPPVLVPVFILFLGIGDGMKVAVIAFGCAWPILLNTIEGVRAVDDVLVETAQTFRITGVARLRHVVLPSAAPQVFAGLRQGLSVAIILMVISELFAASNGLGFAIVQAQRTFAIADMWAGMLVLGLLGLLLAAAFRAVENRALAWYHGLRRAQRTP